ncbi:MAG: ATP-binding protein [Bacteroidales bacterium]
MKPPGTPFPTTGYYGPAFFCDREAELEQLRKNFEGGHSTTLISLRRLGKTALIKHFFHHLGSGAVTIYLDILPTESLGDFLNRLSTAILEQIPEKSPLGKKMWHAIRSLRPVVSYDALSGTPQISIRSNPEESKKSIGELLRLLEAQSRPVVIAIDEFQQILRYRETRTDAWLRSLVQELRNVSFVFSGSQQHLMTELFSSPDRPFFRSTQFLKIGKIPGERYAPFIGESFRKQGRQIDAEIVDAMLAWASGHTYYVQLLCNRVFLTHTKLIRDETWKEEALKILKEQEPVFFAYREMLTKPQWDLLKAIAKEEIVHHPHGAFFLSGHGLRNQATVHRSLLSLLKQELVYREHDSEGRPFYGVYDVLFSRWIGR